MTESHYEDAYARMKTKASEAELEFKDKPGVCAKCTKYGVVGSELTFGADELEIGGVVRTLMYPRCKNEANCEVHRAMVQGLSGS